MESITSLAFKFTVQVGDRLQEHVVAGNDLAAAAVLAQQRVPAEGRVVNMVELGEVLAEPEERLGAPPVVAAVKPVVPPVKPKPSTPRRAAPAPQSTRAAPTAPAVPGVGTRRDQLLALLREHGGPLHLEVVASALEIKRGHADELARQAIKAGLVERVGSRTGKVKLVEVNAATRPGGAPEAELSPEPAPPRSRPSGPTRVERLVELLREKAQPVHLDVIAAELGMTRGNADGAVRHAARAGLVRRVGSRTGLVELVTTAATAAPVAEGRPPLAGPIEPPAEPAPHGTRVEQLVALLRDRSGPVHVRDIRVALSIKPANVHNVVAQGVKAGVVRRVGHRTGLVELAGPLSGLERRQDEQDASEVTDEAAEPQRLDPAQLEGIRRSVYDALVELDGLATAKEVAGQVGCRPREAGNVLALLVEGGLVEREAGDRAAGRATRYCAP